MAKQEKAIVDRAVAIVLASAGSERDVLRKVALTQPWRVVAHTDPMAAIVEVALAWHASATHRSNESNGSPDAIAFIFAVSNCSVRDELIATMTHYFPSVEIHRFDEKGLHRLAVKKQPSITAKQPPKQRKSAAVQNANTTTTDNTPGPSPTITREEIDMLLGAPDLEQDPKKREGGRT